MQVVYLGGKDKHWQGREEVRQVKKGLPTKGFQACWSCEQLQETPPQASYLKCEEAGVLIRQSGQGWSQQVDSWNICEFSVLEFTSELW